MGSDNSKVQDIVFTLKTKKEKVCYLGIFCYNAIVMFTCLYLYNKYADI